jgi:GT2 family glycosyltransferase
LVKDTFINLLDFIDKHDDIGIVSPKILNEDGTVQGLNKRYPAITDLFIRRFFPRYSSQFPIVRRRLDYYEMRDIGYDHIYDVPLLSGSFMFCRTDLLKKLRGFNPKYFLYFEDFDLCRRVQETHRTVYNPHASVIHFWERDAHINWVFTYYFMRSAFRYCSSCHKKGCDGSGRSECLETLAVKKVQDVVEKKMNNDLATSIKCTVVSK